MVLRSSTVLKRALGLTRSDVVTARVLSSAAGTCVTAWSCVVPSCNLLPCLHAAVWCWCALFGMQLHVLLAARLSVGCFHAVVTARVLSSAAGTCVTAWSCVVPSCNLHAALSCWCALSCMLVHVFLASRLFAESGTCCRSDNVLYRQYSTVLLMGHPIPSCNLLPCLHAALSCWCALSCMLVHVFLASRLFAESGTCCRSDNVLYRQYSTVLLAATPSMCTLCMIVCC